MEKCASRKYEPPDRGKENRGITADTEMEYQLDNISDKEEIIPGSSKNIKKTNQSAENEVCKNILLIEGIPTNLINEEGLLNKDNLNQYKQMSKQKTMNDNGSTKTGKDNIVNRPRSLYSLNDQGPFYVYIQNKEGNIGKYHKIGTARLILNSVPEIQNNILNISIIGYNRVKIELDTAKSANLLVESKTLKEKNYEVYIPSFFTQRKGVIKQVDREIHENELVDIIKPRLGNFFEVLNVQRIKRKIVVDNEIQLIPTTTIIVTFKGKTLPSQVIIEKLCFHVEPYIQRTVQCLKCLRYGHISTQCRGKERCKNCGQEHNNEVCQAGESLVCALCTGEHSATDRKKCPEYAKQNSIKTLMCLENLTYKEAVTKYSNNYASTVKSNIPQKIDNNISNFFTSIKRKRIESPTEPNNPLLAAHAEILSQPKISSQPVFNTFKNIPQYHNKNSERVTKGNNIQEVCELIVESIINTLQSINKNIVGTNIVDSLKLNISQILNNNV